MWLLQFFDAKQPPASTQNTLELTGPRCLIVLSQDPETANLIRRLESKKREAVQSKTPVWQIFDFGIFGIVYW